MAAQAAEIRADRVAAVQREELALDVGREVVHDAHAVDLRQLALPAGAFHVPLGKFLDCNVQRRSKVHFRHNAVDRTVGKSNIFVCKGLCFLVQQVVDRTFQLARSPDGVFTRDDVQRRGIARCLPRSDAGSNGLCHDRQDAQADGGRDQLGGFQRLGQLGAGGADAVNVRDGERGGIPILNVDGVLTS